MAFALPLALPVHAQFPSAGCCPTSTPLIPLFCPHTVGTAHSAAALAGQLEAAICATDHYERKHELEASTPICATKEALMAVTLPSSEENLHSTILGPTVNLLNFPYSVLGLYLILSDNPDMDLCSAM